VFEILPFVPPGGPPSAKHGANSDDSEEDLSLIDLEGNDIKPSQNSVELEALNEDLEELLDGIREDFYAVVD